MLKSKKIIFFMFSLSFVTLSFLALFLGSKPYLSKADTVVEDYMYDTYYNIASDFEIHSQRYGDGFSDYSTFIKGSTYYMNPLPLGVPPSAITDTSVVASSLLDYTYLRRVVMSSYPLIQTTWSNMDYFYESGESEFGQIVWKDKYCPNEMLSDLCRTHMRSSYNIFWNIDIEMCSNSLYNGETYTYSQPYLYSNGGSLEASLNDNVLVELVSVDDLATIYSDVGSTDLFIKSMVLTFSNDDTNNEPYDFTLDILFDTSHQITRADYQYNYLDIAHGRYFMNQKEDNALGLLFAPVTAFLRTEIAPNITFGYLVLIALALGTIGFTIKVVGNA